MLYPIPTHLTACHRALQCPDILELVFETMMPLWHKPDQNTCANSARVCRSFLAPATRALWSNLRDLWPLWKILRPTNRVRVAPRRIDSAYFAAILEDQPFLDPVRWESFLRCAARVKGLYTSHGLTSNQARVCRALVHHNDGRTFLPSLQRLPWAHDRECGSDLVILLAPSTLHTLYLRYRYDSNQRADDQDYSVESDSEVEADEVQVQATENILPLLAAQCPSLQTLHIGNSHMKTAALLPELLLFRKLRALDTATTCWSRSAIFNLPSLRTLMETLPLEVLTIHIGGFTPSSNLTIDCPDLRELSVTGTSADAAALAQSFRGRALTTFRTIFMDDAIPLSEFQSLVQAALSPDFSLSLRVLRIDPRVHRHPPVMVSHNNVSLPAILRPGPSLLRIEELALAFHPSGFAVSLTDDDALALARGMPVVRHLVLGCVNSSMPTPRALLHFATYCPELHSLTLSGLEGGPVPGVPALPALATPGHPLRNLQLLGAKTDAADPAGLATFLCRLFPNLQHTTMPRRITNGLPGGDDSLEGWRELNVMLIVLRE